MPLINERPTITPTPALKASVRYHIEAALIAARATIAALEACRAELDASDPEAARTLANRASREAALVKSNAFAASNQTQVLWLRADSQEEHS